MAKKKTAPELVGPEIDPTSDEVVLYHVGHRSARNAPARDLTHNDIARLAYRETLAEVVRDVSDHEDAPSRPDPRSPDQERCSAIYADLLASGQFSTEPVDEPTEADELAPPLAENQPADPAETEEAPGV